MHTESQHQLFLFGDSSIATCITCSGFKVATPSQIFLLMYKILLHRRCCNIMNFKRCLFPSVGTQSAVARVTKASHCCRHPSVPIAVMHCNNSWIAGCIWVFGEPGIAGRICIFGESSIHKWCIATYTYSSAQQASCNSSIFPSSPSLHLALHIHQWAQQLCCNNIQDGGHGSVRAGDTVAMQYTGNSVVGHCVATQYTGSSVVGHCVATVCITTDRHCT